MTSTKSKSQMLLKVFLLSSKQLFFKTVSLNIFNIIQEVYNVNLVLKVSFF